MHLRHTDPLRDLRLRQRLEEPQDVDHTLTLGQDVSIGYLSHNADTIELYLQESFTFLAYTAEASVVLQIEADED